MKSLWWVEPKTRKAGVIAIVDADEVESRIKDAYTYGDIQDWYAVQVCDAATGAVERKFTISDFVPEVEE